jgi:glycosyltransferase involved in cell wall biosynthesis
VTFTGWLDEASYLAVLASASVGIDTNLQEEVTPVKGLEYLSMGVPMVAFDLAETREMAQDAAVYVAPGDVASMAESIAALLTDAGGRARMGAAGRRRIQEALSWEHQAERYVDVLLAGPRNDTPSS